MFRGLSILKRFALCVGTLLVFLVASACVGVFGLNHLFAAANGAVTHDAVLAQRAALIDILVLNERRFEKDTFINLADATALASYHQKWDETRAQLTKELEALRVMALDEADQRTAAQIEASFRDYSSGFEHTFAMIRGGQLKTTAEANTELARYKAAVHKVEEASERLNQRAMSKMNDVSGMLVMTRARTAGVQGGIAVFCVLLAVVLCALTARSITVPLKRAQQIAASIATGNFNNQIAATGADEIAKVLAALKTMQESLLENELNAKGQLSSISKALAVAEFELDGSIRTANVNFLSLFSYELNQIRGRSHELLLDPNERGETERGLWQRLRRGTFDSGQYKRLTQTGHEIFVQASYNPILDLEGKPYKVVLYASDVTDQVRMKRALDDAVRDTQAVVQAAMNGDLAARINLQGKSGQIEALAVSVNALIETKMKLVAQIQETVREINTAAQEISAGNTNLSERTCQQSASLEETSSSMEEMATAVKAAANNAQVAQQLAFAARKQATRGGEILDTAIASMGEINNASAKIGDIITVIDEIAFQTNLLALNAAVEAARAGEQGRGFAVVASEVRGLAGRSATAAKEIKALIGDSLDKVKGGSQTVNESGQALGEIDFAVKRVTDVVAEMASVSQEHASAIEQVNRAVVQMDQVTQQNAALAEEAAAATKSIVQQVSRLEDLIARYRVTEAVSVGRQRTASRGPSAPRPVFHATAAVQ